MIQITSTIGVGNTALGAFDNALYKTGVANYNLLRLSSVIPYGVYRPTQPSERQALSRGYEYNRFRYASKREERPRNL